MKQTAESVINASKPIVSNIAEKTVETVANAKKKISDIAKKKDEPSE